MNLLNLSHEITLNKNKLNWQHLQPIAATLSFDALPENTALLAQQAALTSALELFCRQNAAKTYQFMVIKAKKTADYFDLITQEVRRFEPASRPIFGQHYHFLRDKIIASPAKTKHDNFAANAFCLAANWFENESLLGYFRQRDDNFSLHPGLIHRANGGILVLSVATFLNQAGLWSRFKHIVQTRSQDWLCDNQQQTLPYFIPTMPIDLKVILIGDRDDLSDFEYLEPELYQQALYAEFESEYDIIDENEVYQWAAYTKALAHHDAFPEIDASVYPLLIKEAVKLSEDQLSLPLCPTWIKTQWLNAAFFASPKIDHNAYKSALTAQFARENYLPKLLLDEINQGQIKIDTQSQIIGQVNGLTVLEYPGHPREVGLPSRISCVLRQGDGEITDIEHRAELSGNIHAKSIMIMQAFVAHELALEKELPYSASVAFEQSYCEIDGDSASLASLCAYISALALLPADQQMAITGSVDQFGNVQPIGGINQKIAGFFDICSHQTLTGQQGVILPLTNIRHLCLRDDIVDAVKNEQFHLWPVEHAYQAFEILLSMAYKSENEQSETIFKRLQTRIKKQNNNDDEKCSRLLKWFSRQK